MKPRIILADDHVIIREGIRNMIHNKGLAEIVAEADNGKDALRLACEFFPEIIIMDVSMPDMNGIEATRHILSELPNTKIIALSMHKEEQKVLEMLRAGALGYMLKDCTFHDITKAIDTVLRGKTFISPTIGGDIIRTSLEKLKETDIPPKSLLTHAEREVLQLIAEGKSNKEIADFFSISEKTVKTHRQHVMDKLNLHSVAELTKYAIREGITEV